MHVIYAGGSREEGEGGGETQEARGRGAIGVEGLGLDRHGGDKYLYVRTIRGGEKRRGQSRRDASFVRASSRE